MALARLVTVNALVPATTALLSSLDSKQALESGLQVGASVIMINMSTETARRYYRFYDHRERLTMKEVVRRI